MSEFIARFKERPKDERAAFATMVTAVVMVVLFAVWALFFFSGIRNEAKLSVVRSAGTQPVTPQEIINQVNQMTDAYAQEEAQRAVQEAQQAAAASAFTRYLDEQQIGEDVYVDGITVPVTSTPPMTATIEGE